MPLSDACHSGDVPQIHIYRADSSPMLDNVSYVNSWIRPEVRSQVCLLGLTQVRAGSKTLLLVTAHSPFFSSIIGQAPPLS